MENGSYKLVAASAQDPGSWSLTGSKNFAHLIRRSAYEHAKRDGTLTCRSIKKLRMNAPSMTKSSTNKSKRRDTVPRLLLLVALLLTSGTLLVGQATVQGTVLDSRTRAPLPFVNVLLEGTTNGATTDLEGKFIISNVAPGLYNVIVSSVGYERKTVFEVQVGTARPVVLNIELVPTTTELKEVVITQQPFQRTVESPLSVRTIGSAEIMRNPGGNRDISRVIRSLPGVASTASFRNDIIIRGGAPNENRFYLDGIEVPTINHFSTQGSSGGPVGMINVNFIREVDVITGAFPAARGNTLSSVFEFKQPDGSSERRAFTFMLGSSDAGFTYDGPTGPKATTIISVRRSYLQFLFQALKLPFLPIYNDAQFKHRIQLNDKSRLTFIGLGAYDDLKLNSAANNGVTDEETFERNQYILGNIPVNKQWNYTVGARFDRFVKKGLHTLVASRSMLSNSSKKYRYNDDTDPAGLLLDYQSQESENKVRYEATMTFGGWRFVGGVNYERARYTTDTYSQRILNGQATIIDYSSALSFNKFGGFAQASRTFGKFSGSVGVRTDFTGLGAATGDPIDQLSPRLSLSYAVNGSININANVGRFFQLPPYTVLGYREQGALVNLNNGIGYIQADHVVAGFEYFTKVNTKFSVEGFHKWYDRYPMLLQKGVSLANLGGDFGVIGNEPAAPVSKGRAYGVEFLAQQKLFKGFYGIVAYTFVRSEFTNADGGYAPSSWDYGHIINLTAGKRLPRNWEVGVNWRYQGGGPYTPFDIATSSLITAWDATQQGTPDWGLINTQRLPSFNQLNARVDKRWYFKKWSLNLYLDIENLLGSAVTGPDFVDVVRDANGLPVLDPNDATRYQTKVVSNASTTRVPSIGIMVEF
ncbi:MAG: TonB-dependent receptor [Flavobacteriales bacterium]|nr:TonB-dependent receptor [Flavobacteriales bacterium]